MTAEAARGRLSVNFFQGEWWPGNDGGSKGDSVNSLVCAKSDGQLRFEHVVHEAKAPYQPLAKRSEQWGANLSSFLHAYDTSAQEVALHTAKTDPS